MLEPYSASLTGLVVLGFIIAFVLAFGIGANDVANSFGTSVGSKVLTIYQACWLATIFEVSGAILIGYKVSDTIRKGILDVNVYKDSEKELVLGCVSALAASAVWLIVATFFKVPISGTHSIVGATIGYNLVARGAHGVHWKTLATVVGSWFISPVLSGLTSCGIMWIITKCILRKPDPLERGLLLMPLFYSFTILTNVFSVVHNGPKLLHMDNISLGMAFIISIGIAIVTMVVVWLFVVPWQRRVIKNDKNNKKDASSCNLRELEDTIASPNKSCRNSAPVKKLTAISKNCEVQTTDNNTAVTAKYIFPAQTNNKCIYTPARETDESSSVNTVELTYLKSDELIDVTSVNSTVFPSTSGGVSLILNKNLTNGNNDQEVCNSKETSELTNKQVSKLFSFLQVLTATFGSFAHGGNDVSNAIGPLITLWLIYTEGTVQQKAEVPIYMLVYGGIGISLGLWLWGRRVIETVGEDLTVVTPSTGFTIETGAAFTVLFASKIGLPISTTHCKVGSVVFVGYFSSSKEGVDWSLFRNIIFAWLITVPIAGLLSAGCMLLLSYLIL